MENPSDPLSPAYTPVAPKYVYAEVMSDTVVNIQWYEEAVGEHGFHLYRNSDLDTMFRLIAVIPRGINWYSDVGAKVPGVRYNYRLYSYAGEHESSLFVVTWFRYSLLPPADVTASASGPSRVRLGWRNASSIRTATHIERDRGSGFETIGVTSLGAVAFIDTSAGTNQVLTYRLTARTHYHSSTAAIVQYTTGG